MKKKLLFLSLCYLTAFTSIMAQNQEDKAIVVMDFVKIKNQHKAEAVYYYENNCKQLRVVALAKGYISAYQMIVAKEEEKQGEFDIILMTTYPNRASFDKSEENFAPIMNELQPNGPQMLNELKPADFREVVYNKTGLLMD